MQILQIFAMHGKKVRKIFIDNDTANAGRRFATNYIQTTKYTALSFLPLFLIDQFTKPANLFYVCVGILQVMMAGFFSPHYML